MPADQEKAGETPHTLHKRRPQNNKDTQQNSQTDYTQWTEQQQESLSGENQETRLGKATDRREISEPTVRGTKTLSPDPFLVTSYGGKDCRKAMTSTTPREHRERTQLYGGDWCQAERTNQAEQLTQDAMENDTIKDAWIKLIQEEYYLSRDVMTFLP